MMTIRHGEGSSATSLEPLQLRPFFSERIWGRTSLEPWFAETGTKEPVGEAWLTGPQCVVENGAMAGKTLAEVARERGAELLGSAGLQEFPLLVKILFPNEKLSVQVHPDDERAQKMGQPRGKTECWYVLEAEPGAAVALGLREGADREAVRNAIGAGTLEKLLQQVPVSPGDMIFVDAGTIHAIGPGVTLLETQQTSDTTFRMWDYGRPRELHVEQGLEATKFQTRAGKTEPRAGDGFVRLIEEQYFTVDRFDLRAERRPIRMDGPGCLVGLAGRAMLRFAGGELALERGRAVVIPAGTEVAVEAAEAMSFARCFAPAAA
jgi:mannose-6-phosphate isomerase